MANFWKWGFRNPALLLAVCAFASGAGGVVDWSIGMSATMLFALVAEAGDMLTRRAQSRDDRRREEAARAAFVSMLPTRMAPQAGSERRRAA